MTRPARPTKEFFETDPAAAEIRTLTLDGLAGCIHRLLGKDGWNGRIVDSATALQERGVAPGMHLIETDDPAAFAQEQQALMTSPRRAAEFVAGMFLGYLYEWSGALDMPVPSTYEERETFLRMIGEGVPPPEVREASIDLDTLGGMERMLDKRPEEHRYEP